MTEKGTCILLIEDNVGDALLIREAMSEGQKVVTAQSLAEGISCAAKCGFDLVLLDLSLPDSHGLETVESAIAAFPWLPVVVLTGMNEEQVGIAALRAGAQDYLVKGRTSNDALARSIRYAVERHAIHQALLEARDHLEERVRGRTADLAKTVDALQAEVRQRLEEEEKRRRAEIDVLQAAESEQRRIGRDLHDSIQGSLSGVGFMLASLKQRLLKSPVEAAKLVDDIDNLISIVKRTVDQTRGLARGLCPVELKGEGLAQALAKLASTSSDLFGINCVFLCPQPVTLANETLATQLYYIGQEAVNNALRHAKANCVMIRLEQSNARLALIVEDDGIGIAPGACSTGGGLGLRAMHYRAAIMGANLTVQRGPAGGTSICCHLAGIYVSTA